MHYHDYREDRRDGRAVFYKREREGCGDCAETVVREPIKGEIRYYIERGYHFHLFDEARRGGGEVTYRRKDEGCAECAFTLVVSASEGGEPARISLVSEAADFVNAKRRIEARRAAAVAKAFGKPAPLACAAI